MSTKTNFIILFQGRAGSTFLVDSLRNHPDIYCKSEILLKYTRSLRPGEKIHLPKRIYRQLLATYRGSVSERQSIAVERFYDRSASRHYVAAGFKTKVSDIASPEAMKQILESKNVKVIAMVRKNVIKQAVSRIRARILYEKTKGRNPQTSWNLYDEKDRLGPQTIQIAELDKVLKIVIFHNKVMSAFIDLLELPVLHLEYSELLADREASFLRVFEFLGARPLPLKCEVLKNTDDNLRNAILNFDELKKHYANTEFEPMFEERVQSH
jgi:LPS sulfotransferase NodH